MERRARARRLRRHQALGPTQLVLVLAHARLASSTGVLVQNPSRNSLIHSLGRFRNQRLQTANIIIRARRGRFEFGNLDENLLHARRDFRLARLVVQTLLARLETREGVQSARRRSVIECSSDIDGKSTKRNDAIGAKTQTHARVYPTDRRREPSLASLDAPAERPSKAPRRARSNSSGAIRHPPANTTKREHDETQTIKHYVPTSREPPCFAPRARRKPPVCERS